MYMYMYVRTKILCCITCVCREVTCCPQQLLACALGTKLNTSHTHQSALLSRLHTLAADGNVKSVLGQTNMKRINGASQRDPVLVQGDSHTSSLHTSLTHCLCARMCCLSAWCFNRGPKLCACNALALRVHCHPDMYAQSLFLHA